MGRVAKYKKIRACDPFAKRSTRERSGLTSSDGMMTLDPKRRASLKKRQRRAKRKPNGQGEDFDGGFDAPPQEKDDFDLADPTLTVPRQKSLPSQSSSSSLCNNEHDDATTTTSTTMNTKSGSGDDDGSTKKNDGLTCHIPQSDKDEARMVRELNLVGSGGSSKEALSLSSKNANSYKTNINNNTNDNNNRNRSTAITTGRKEGESMNAFRKRVDRETRQILMKQAQTEQASKKSSFKAEKKKAFLNKKKTMKKGRGRKKKQFQINGDDDYYDNNNNDNDGTERSNEERKLVVATTTTTTGLVDQVERPPVFSVLPRGAKKKRENGVLVGKDNSGGVGVGGDSLVLSDEEKQARERRSMEIMRNKVIASYALLKAKRKQRF